MLIYFVLRSSAVETDLRREDCTPTHPTHPLTHTPTHAPNGTDSTHGEKFGAVSLYSTGSSSEVFRMLVPMHPERNSLDSSERYSILVKCRLWLCTGQRGFPCNDADADRNENTWYTIRSTKYVSEVMIPREGVCAVLCCAVMARGNGGGGRRLCEGRHASQSGDDMSP